MTREVFDEIMNLDFRRDWSGDNAMQGLLLISEFFDSKKTLITGADHDIIYSVDVDELIAAGITAEDAVRLRSLNWMIESDHLACYV